MELLEGQDTPTIFTVTTLPDAGDGSLRDAIARANDEVANPGPDDIVFAPSAAGRST
ncbi:MAG TPA: hypothetical protein VKE74_30525 [Gemmataceae bacterium]|nr:hypothetical protein [Gemmataceae bacterium]